MIMDIESLLNWLDCSINDLKSQIDAGEELLKKYGDSKDTLTRCKLMNAVRLGTLLDVKDLLLGDTKRGGLVAEKTFLIKMNDAQKCERNFYFGNGKYVCYELGHERVCKGDLDNRPDWCPLVPVKNIEGTSMLKNIWVEDEKEISNRT